MVFSSFLEYFFFMFGWIFFSCTRYFLIFFFFTEFTWFHGRVTVGNGGDKGVGRPVGIFFSLFFFFLFFDCAPRLHAYQSCRSKNYPQKKKKEKKKTEEGRGIRKRRSGRGKREREREKL